MPNTGVKPQNPVVNRSHPLAQGLVGAWPFEDGGGTVLRDVSGHGNDGTLVNAPTFVGSRFGGALDFDGLTNYVRSTPDLSSLADMTVSAWVQVPSGTPGTYGDIVSTQNTAASNGILAHVSGAHAQWKFFAYYSGGTISLVSPKTWQDGTPHLFVGVLRGTTAELYLDGALAASGSSSGAVSFSSAVVHIGARASLHSAAFFSDQISDVRLWNRALSASEVADLYSDPWALYRPARPVKKHYYVSEAAAAAAGGGAWSMSRQTLSFSNRKRKR
jgi:hypothetical protein